MPSCGVCFTKLELQSTGGRLGAAAKRQRFNEYAVGCKSENKTKQNKKKVYKSGAWRRSSPSPLSLRQRVVALDMSLQVFLSAVLGGTQIAAVRLDQVVNHVHVLVSLTATVKRLWAVLTLVRAIVLVQRLDVPVEVSHVGQRGAAQAADELLRVPRRGG